MTEQEIERLVALVVEALLRQAPAVRPDDVPRDATWLPTPVRPEPPARSTEPPLWSGAAQRLDDVAPGLPAGRSGAGAAAGAGAPRRVSTADLTNAVRAAAAGRAPAPEVAPVGRVRHRGTSRLRSLELDVAVGVSNRHVHLSPEHARQLFGLDPAGHHATSLLLHLANTLLLFAVLRGMTGALWRSAAVAALYSGYMTPQELAVAGSVAGAEDDLALAAQIFAGPRPWTPDMF